MGKSITPNHRAIEGWTPHYLARRMEHHSNGALKKACDACYKLALHGHERISEVRARLGDEHPAFKEWDAQIVIMNAYVSECIRRYGKAVTYDSLWPNFLYSQKT